MQARNDYHEACEEESSLCARFPHMSTCACDVDCQLAIREISLIEVYEGIFMGPFQAAFKTKALIELGVTHILNVSSKSYTKRKKVFKYLDIPIHDEEGEEAKKHFRTTNRFINECL